LAEELNVTPPAVTAALKRMTRDGLVRVDRNGRIDLTQKGRAIAERLALRHQLAERLLTEVIGLSWAKAHDEAERLEHAISPEVEALLLKRFGDKDNCPHGVPMRGGIAKLRRQGAVLLADLRAKERGEILCVYEKDVQFLEFLEGLRLRPSTKLEVVNREYDETMTLRCEGKTMHLGKPATSRIWVRRLTT
jgi:DtxR family Mn-dependent transcriptional regulator